MATHTPGPETGLARDGDAWRIAAAPELLAMLRELAPDLAWGTTSGWKGGTGRHDRLLALIARATGATP